MLLQPEGKPIGHRIAEHHDLRGRRDVGAPRRGRARGIGGRPGAAEKPVPDHLEHLWWSRTHTPTVSNGNQWSTRGNSQHQRQPKRFAYPQHIHALLRSSASVDFVMHSIPRCRRRSAASRGEFLGNIATAAPAEVRAVLCRCELSVRGRGLGKGADEYDLAGRSVVQPALDLNSPSRSCDVASATANFSNTSRARAARPRRRATPILVPPRRPAVGFHRGGRASTAIMAARLTANSTLSSCRGQALPAARDRTTA